jgi:hypothetical protein
MTPGKNQETELVRTINVLVEKSDKATAAAVARGEISDDERLAP